MTLHVSVGVATLQVSVALLRTCCMPLTHHSAQCCGTVLLENSCMLLTMHACVFGAQAHEQAMEADL